MASVQKREGSQGVKWRVKYSTAARQQAYEVFTDEAKAREFAHLCNEFSAEHALMVLREKEGGIDSSPFIDVATNFMAERTGVRDVTRNNYKYCLAYCEPLHHIPVGAMSASVLRRWVEWMQHTCGLSSASMETAKGFACAVMNEAVRLKMTDSNPIVKLKIPKVLQGKRKHHVVTPEELEILLSGIKRDSDKTLVMTLFSVGLRIGEVTALQVRHVHFNRKKNDGSGWFEIEQSWSDGVTGQPKVLVTGKTDAATRLAFFGPTLGKLLMLLVEGRRGDDWLFTTARGNYIKRTYFNEYVWHPARALLSGDTKQVIQPEGLTAAGRPKRKRVKYLPDGGGPRPVLHDLRRSFITWSARAGVPITTTARQVGHANIAVTAEIYTQVEAEDLAGGVAQIEAFLSQAPDELVQERGKEVEVLHPRNMVVSGTVVTPPEDGLAAWLKENYRDIYNEWVRLS